MKQVTKIFRSIDDGKYIFESINISLDKNKKNDTLDKSIHRELLSQKKNGVRQFLFSNFNFILLLKELSKNDEIKILKINGNNSEVCKIVNMFIENINDLKAEINTVVDMLNSYIKYHDDFYIADIEIEYNNTIIKIDHAAVITNDNERTFYNKILLPFLNELYNV